VASLRIVDERLSRHKLMSLYFSATITIYLLSTQSPLLFPLLEFPSTVERTILSYSCNIAQNITAQTQNTLT
jgi:hypothetical protein